MLYGFMFDGDKWMGWNIDHLSWIKWIINSIRKCCFQMLSRWRISARALWDISDRLSWQISHLKISRSFFSEVTRARSVRARVRARYDPLNHMPVNYLDIALIQHGRSRSGADLPCLQGWFSKKEEGIPQVQAVYGRFPIHHEESVWGITREGSRLWGLYDILPKTNWGNTRPPPPPP